MLDNLKIKLIQHKNKIKAIAEVANAIAQYAITKSSFSLVGGGITALELIFNINSNDPEILFSPVNNWVSLTPNKPVCNLFLSTLDSFEGKKLPFEYELAKLFNTKFGNFVVIYDRYNSTEMRILTEKNNKEQILSLLGDAKIKELDSKFIALDEISTDANHSKLLLTPLTFKSIQSQKSTKFITELQKSFDNNISRSLMLYGLPGCHIKGQPIMMIDGTTKKVEDIIVGDTLMGPLGSPRNILELRQGFGKMVKIIPIKGKSFIVNEDHILTLIKNNKKLGKDLNKFPHYEYIDVSVKDYLKWNAGQMSAHKLVRSKVNNFPGDGKALPLDPYMLGVLIGDGTLKNAIQLTNNDKEVIETAKKFAVKFGLNLNLVNTTQPSADTYNFSGSKNTINPLHLIIKSMNLNVNSGDKFIPHEYKISSIENRLAILAGLIDTDGSLSNNCFDYISKSCQLAEDIAFVARSVGLAAYISICKKSAHKNHIGTYYRVCISGNNNIIPTKIPRKQARARKQIKNVLYTNFHIEYVADNDYYGFTLNKDGRYLLDDFTITHNTGKTTLSNTIMDHFGFRTLKLHPNDAIKLPYFLEIIDILKIEALILDDFDQIEMNDKLLEFLETVNTKLKLVIGIANILNGFDPAVLRPGRFDELIKIEELEEQTLREILGDLTERFFTKVRDWPIAYVKELTKQSILNPESLDIKYEELNQRIVDLKTSYENLETEREEKNK